MWFLFVFSISLITSKIFDVMQNKWKTVWLAFNSLDFISKMGTFTKWKILLMPNKRSDSNLSVWQIPGQTHWWAKTVTTTNRRTKNHAYFPKSSGSDVNDISFNPNTVRFFKWENPGGRRSIGFELKSAVCKLFRCRISSGMSGISEKTRRSKKIIIIFSENNIQFSKMIIIGINYGRCTFICV